MAPSLTRLARKARAAAGSSTVRSQKRAALSTANPRRMIPCTSLRLICIVCPGLQAPQPVPVGYMRDCLKTPTELGVGIHVANRKRRVGAVPDLGLDLVRARPRLEAR